jgi:photosystem II stability/assembly factor-like uncharacterized protein
MLRSCLAVLCIVPVLALAAEAAPEKPKSEYGALNVRLLGPAIGGRVAGVAGVPGDPNTYYLAAAQGGVWKSENGGFGWKPIFDDQLTNSIGSIAVAPSDPNVIYVGSGEANPRGNVLVGWGIWKSTDAGKTWKHVWKAKGQVGAIAIHPTDPDIAYAAALGSPFGPGDQRGVYRTRNGGKTWQRVHFIDRETGASDVALAARNPRIVYAGFWQMRRTPWNLTSGGPGSALARSDDGGDTWKKLSGSGLPDGEWGKVGVAVAPGDSNRVYALIEAKEGGLFRSDDGGASFARVSGHRILRQRAWYYSTLTVDPNNRDVVWFPQVPLIKTVDGGKTLVRVPGTSHGDHHALWIDPRDSRRLIVGHDGGVDISVDGGATWFGPDLPLAQFYNIDVDDRLPWRVGGTIQDMGTASGPNMTPLGDGPVLADWHYVGGGEAGDFKYDPAQPGHVYAGEYGGYISHYVEGTGQYRAISAWPANPSGLPARQLDYRYQWTAPIALSPHDQKVLYHGANVLFRSLDRGHSWQPISPDLTRDDESKQQWSGGPITGDITGVETYDTIFSIAESPLVAGEIWVGTDDGKVQLTRDGGVTWSDVTPSSLPAWATVEAIEPSRHDAGVAYVAVDARRLDDQRPYVFRTADHGKSWKLVVDGLPADQPILVVREDPTDANLLYAGGERGVHVSRDGSASWTALTIGLPPVAVPDLEVKHDALVLGTRRGIWVLDDLAPVRGFDAALKQRAVHLFAPPVAIAWSNDYRWGDQGKMANPAYGVTFSYWLAKESKDPISAEVIDAEGRTVRKLSSVALKPKYPKDDLDQPSGDIKPELTTAQGLNRATWNLRMDGARRVESKIDTGDPENGPQVAPGRYTLRLTAAGATVEAPIEVRPDPRVPAGTLDAKARVAFALELRGALDRAATAIAAVRSIREQSSALATYTKDQPNADALREAVKAVVQRCDAIEGELHNPQAEVNYDILAGREGGAKLYSQMSPLYDWAQSANTAPTQSMRDRYAVLNRELTRLEGQIAELRRTELAAVEQQADALQLPRVIVPAR